MTMRALFDIDTKDYDPKGPAFVRPSVRGIILRDGKVAMVHSLKYDYYKFPGGGIEAGETRPQALIREVLEESGLQVRPESIREYGLVHRVQKSDQPGIAMFVQDNSYYLCDVQPEVQSQHLDDYEAEEHFTLEFVAPETAIQTNRLPEIQIDDGISNFFFFKSFIVPSLFFLIFSCIIANHVYSISFDFVLNMILFRFFLFIFCLFLINCVKLCFFMFIK